MKFPKTGKQLREIRETWLQAWLSSNRNCPFPRTVSDALRTIGTSSREVEEIVSSLLMLKPHEIENKEQRALVLHYRDMLIESKMNLEENVSSNPRSAIFLLQSKYGYDSKQTVRLEETNLSDIVRENSQHGG